MLISQLVALSSTFIKRKKNTGIYTSEGVSLLKIDIPLKYQEIVFRHERG